jgi:cytochrome subunit of sulfide dehydrogenase
MQLALRTCLGMGLSIAAGLAVCGGETAGAVEADKGARLASICASCHDPSGTDRGIPSIVGLDEKQIIEAMLRYRESEAPSIVMHAIALSLSEEEIASVARFLAAEGKDDRR